MRSEMGNGFCTIKRRVKAIKRGSVGRISVLPLCCKLQHLISRCTPLLDWNWNTHTHARTHAYL